MRGSGSAFLPRYVNFAGGRPRRGGRLKAPPLRAPLSDGRLTGSHATGNLGGHFLGKKVHAGGGFREEAIFIAPSKRELQNCITKDSPCIVVLQRLPINLELTVKDPPLNLAAKLELSGRLWVVCTVQFVLVVVALWSVRPSVVRPHGGKFPLPPPSRYFRLSFFSRAHHCSCSNGHRTNRDNTRLPSCQLF